MTCEPNTARSTFLMDRQRFQLYIYIYIYKIFTEEKKNQLFHISKADPYAYGLLLKKWLWYFQHRISLNFFRREAHLRMRRLTLPAIWWEISHMSHLMIRQVSCDPHYNETCFTRAAFYILESFQNVLIYIIKNTKRLLNLALFLIKIQLNKIDSHLV